MTNQKFLDVIDTSATAENPKRIHDIFVDGMISQVEFNYGRPTQLPYETGVKFMKDGFKVFNAGEHVQLVPPPKTEETIRIRIADDEVVAKWTELSDSALRLRVAILPGGERLAATAERGDLLTFLRGAVKPVELPADEGVEFDEEGVDVADLALKELEEAKAAAASARALLQETPVALVEDAGIDAINVATIPAGGTIVDAEPLPGHEATVEAIKESIEQPGEIDLGLPAAEAKPKKAKKAG